MLVGPAVALALVGCSSSDYVGPAAPSSPPVAAAPAPAPADVAPTVTQSALPPPAGHTGSDGYPNINVDTAAPIAEPTRSAEDRDRLEAELMALGERQRASAGGSPHSVVQELKELGRRSKAEALKQIESGGVPGEP